MTFKQMESLCALAETLNFSKAAEKIYLSQSALSREIAALEKELGCVLLERSRKSPKLTAAGERIVRNARRIMEEYREIQHTADIARTGHLGELRIGFIENGLTDDIVRLLQKFAKEMPDVAMEIMDYPEAEIYRAVETEKIDFGIVIHTVASYQNVFNSRVLDHYCQCAIVSENHPLAKLESVHLADLANESFVLINSEDCPEGYSHFINRGLESKFVPRVALEVESAYSMLVNVSCNLGISMGPASLSMLKVPNLRFVPIVDENELEYQLIWSKANHAAPIGRFLELLDR
jgi:DNA-binding transcriptional LysR family regulator